MRLQTFIGRYGDAIAARDGGWQCHYCNADLNPPDQAEGANARDTACIDHRIPVCKGGSDDLDNLVLCCRSCNAQKGTKTAQEYEYWKWMRAMDMSDPFVMIRASELKLLLKMAFGQEEKL